MFFGFDILCSAYLVLRSRFLPRTIGVLLAIDGVAYLVYSFTDILAPEFATGSGSSTSASRSLPRSLVGWDTLQYSR